MYIPDAPSIDRLMRGDLNFKGSSPEHATHNTHAFAAKFPPQLPSIFIRELSREGDVVLDPMAGSGTAIVEAMRLGRIGVGADIDPLAAKICSAKSTPLDTLVVERLGREIVERAATTVASGGSSYAQSVLDSLDSGTAEFIEYWFLPHTIAELGALSEAMQALVPSAYASLFHVLFSSVIVTKSGGVSLARDLAHSRPHKVTDKKIKNAVSTFGDKVAKSVTMLCELKEFKGTAHVIRADSRELALANDSADLIVTSPPYANAIDYVRAHKFSLVWLGHKIGDLSGARRQYIGAEVRSISKDGLETATGTDVLRKIETLDSRRARIVRHYFEEMTRSIAEMHRVLKVGRSAVVVVGSSTVRGILVPTALILAEIGQGLGFRLVALKERDIDRDRRLMPISRSSDETGIEARMHSEHVIVFLKP